MEKQIQLVLADGLLVVVEVVEVLNIVTLPEMVEWVEVLMVEWVPLGVMLQ
jgi:hypothetical protein